MKKNYEVKVGVFLEFADGRKKVEMTFGAEEFKTGLIELSKKKDLDLAFDELCRILIKRYRNSG